jgi:hypothetical protein
MHLRYALASALMIVLAGCGVGGPAEQAREPREEAPRRQTVFDPMTSTIGRAEGVQQTVEQQAAEQRRRIDEASR